MVGKTGPTEDHDRIARELGWGSYEAAPHVVQNNIDSKIEGIDDDPFAMLRVVHEQGDE